MHIAPNALAPQNDMVLHPNEIKKMSSAITACRKNIKSIGRSYRHTWGLEIFHEIPLSCDEL